MSFAVPAPSISSESSAISIGSWFRLMADTAWSTLVSRMMGTGPIAYVLSWLMWPVMHMVFMSFLYRSNAELRNYAIVASAGQAILFGLIFNGGEMLDRARAQGFLGNFFLSPMPRFVWLGGLQLCALIETIVNAVLAIALGVLWFDAPIDPDIPAVAVSLVLITIALWGASVMLASAGLYTRNANFLSNLIMPVLTVFSGAMYPVDRMSDWIRIPARCLPFSYANDALVASLTNHASIADQWGTLLPLAGFAVVLPVIGVLMFRRAEFAVRTLGTLELA